MKLYPVGEQFKIKHKATSRPFVMSLTWRDFVGPVCIFVDERWQNGKVVEIHDKHVVYKLSGDPESYIISKDEAHSIIRKRGTVASVGKGQTYTGSNPLIFGPTGCNIYGRKIVERKDRPGNFRVHVKYQSKKHEKVRNIKINLGKHVDSFCDLLSLLCLLCFALLCFVLLCFALLCFFGRQSPPRHCLPAG